MIHIVDTLFSFIFSYVFYWFILIYGVAAIIIAIGALCNGSIEGFSIFGIHAICCYWFYRSFWVLDKYSTWPSMGDEKFFSMAVLSTIFGVGIWIVVAGFIPMALKGLKIPFTITFLFYFGTLIFGT